MNIIANISWNPYKWRSLFTNPKAGHSYVRDYPAHESLNFNFNKKGIDTDRDIYGYIRWNNPPRPEKFSDGDLILFYSRNTEINQGQIVGVYGNASILRPEIQKTYKGFQNDVIWLNVKARKEYSMLFPKPLESRSYHQGRFVGQNGFRYDTDGLIERIISDELTELRTSGIQEEEYLVLKNIFNQYFDKEIPAFNSRDEQEIEEITDYYLSNKEEVVSDLRSYHPNTPELVTVNTKSYKRDNKIIAQLKIYRDFKCQMCETYILKKDGTYYIEAAHIKPKSQKGSESPDNILILCPNHHKEFDLGEREILVHNKDRIKFLLNGRMYEFDLSIKSQVRE